LAFKSSILADDDKDSVASEAFKKIILFLELSCPAKVTEH
jgi:hypothetical protein